MRLKALFLVVALAAAAGCSGKSETKPPAGGQSPAGAPSSVQTVTGTVVETMDASNYTYVRVKPDKGDDVWAATAQFKVAVGDRVTVPLEMPMQNFQSPSLKRDFPLIYFTSHIDRAGEGSQSAPPLMAAHGGVSPASGAPASTEPVAPAAGGMTVADVWAKRDSLAGKTVTVRGRVVKYNGGILDRNWIHIQDGTGDAKDGSNDLAITSQDEARVGDVVTATGQIALKKDFGAGYTYAVLLESAKLAAK